MRAVVSGLCLVVTLVGPQRPADPYRAAIAEYGAGDVEAACSTLAGVPEADVQRAIDTHLAALQSTGSVGARRQLEAIAMLHTDCPLVVAVNPKVALFNIDTAHRALVIARRSVTHELRDTDDLEVRRAREFLPHWYALAASVLLLSNGDQNATRLIDEGVKLFPEDRTLLYWRGLVMEFTAVWVGTRPIGRTDSKVPAPSDAAGASASGALAPDFLWIFIEDAFQRVVHKEPGQMDAHLHHGYALYALGRYDEAIAEYELARDRSTDAFVVYMADLLLGRLEEDRQDLHAAGRDYERALATMPGAQSAYIALASVAARLGDARRAQELTTRLASIPAAQRRRDPWWAFRTARVPDNDRQWLRAAVRR